MIFNEAEHYDFHWREQAGKLACQAEIKEKIRILLKIMPPDVKTIVDLGCGDGTITNILGGKYEVLGVDISQEALKHVQTKTLCASAEHTGLPDKCADLVLSSEVLEHLSEPNLTLSINEIMRLARKYVIITCPFSEKLRRRFTKCGSCGTEHHIYWHVNTFGPFDIQKRFPGYAIRHLALCGPLEQPTFDILSYAKNKLASSWFGYEGCTPQCTKCGLSEKPPPVSTWLVSRAFRACALRFLNKLQGLANFALLRRKQPYGMIILLAESDS